MFTVKDLLKAMQGELLCGEPKVYVKGISTDTRTIKPKQAFLCLKGPNFDGHNFISEAIRRGSSCLIVEKEIRKTSSLRARLTQRKVAVIRVRNTTLALGDIARFQREKFSIPVIAVTGSTGKTTVKEMVAWVLSENFKVLKNEGTKNNQIGVPTTLLKLKTRDEACVLELGTNHPGEIAYLAEICQPNIAVITNIGPAHLEFFKNLAGVFKEKHSLVRFLRRPSIAVLNADEPFLREKLKTKDAFAVSFGIKNHSDFSASGLRRISNRLEFLVNKKYKFTLQSLGYYNIYNALASVAVARLLGMSYSRIAGALSEFDFPSGRLKVIELRHTRYIDDTYNSNPLSLEEALETLAGIEVRGRKIVVMGDMLELGDQAKAFHLQAGWRIAKVSDLLLTVGNLAGLTAQAAKQGGLDSRNVFSCSASTEAREILRRKIRPRKNDLVLVKGSRLMKMEEVFRFASVAD